MSTHLDSSKNYEEIVNDTVSAFDDHNTLNKINSIDSFGVTDIDCIYYPTNTNNLNTNNYFEPKNNLVVKNQNDLDSGLNCNHNARLNDNIYIDIDINTLIESSMPNELLTENVNGSSTPTESFTENVNEPSTSTESFTENVNEPSSPTELFTENVNVSSTSIESLNENVNEPSSPTESFTENVNKPSTSTESSTENANEPSSPTESFTENVNKPSTSTELFTENVNKPSTSTELFTENVNKPSSPTESLTENITKSTTSIELSNEPTTDSSTESSTSSKITALSNNYSDDLSESYELKPLILNYLPTYNIVHTRIWKNIFINKHPCNDFVYHSYDIIVCLMPWEQLTRYNLLYTTIQHIQRDHKIFIHFPMYKYNDDPKCEHKFVCKKICDQSSQCGYICPFLDMKSVNLLINDNLDKKIFILSYDKNEIFFIFCCMLVLNIPFASIKRASKNEVFSSRYLEYLRQYSSYLSEIR